MILFFIAVASSLRFQVLSWWIEAFSDNFPFFDNDTATFGSFTSCFLCDFSSFLHKNFCLSVLWSDQKFHIYWVKDKSCFKRVFSASIWHAFSLSNVSVSLLTRSKGTFKKQERKLDVLNYFINLRIRGLENRGLMSVVFCGLCGFLDHLNVCSDDVDLCNAFFYSSWPRKNFAYFPMSKSPIKRMGSASWHLIVDFLSENWYVAKHSSFYLS